MKRKSFAVMEFLVTAPADGPEDRAGHDDRRASGCFGNHDSVCCIEDDDAP